MEDISSIVLGIFIILSLGIRLFKKNNIQPETEPSEPTAPVKENRKSISTAQEVESDIPISRTYDAPSMPEEPIAERTTKAPEMPENPSISDDFDLAKAVIYSEILKTRTFDEY